MAREQQKAVPQGRKKHKTKSFRFTDSMYYEALTRFSRKEKRREADFIRAKMETVLDEMMSAQS